MFNKISNFKETIQDLHLNLAYLQPTHHLPAGSRRLTWHRPAIPEEFNLDEHVHPSRWQAEAKLTLSQRLTLFDAPGKPDSKPPTHWKIASTLTTTSTITNGTTRSLTLSES